MKEKHKVKAWIHCSCLTEELCLASRLFPFVCCLAASLPHDNLNLSTLIICLVTQLSRLIFETCVDYNLAATVSILRIIGHHTLPMEMLQNAMPGIPQNASKIQLKLSYKISRLPLWARPPLSSCNRNLKGSSILSCLLRLGRLLGSNSLLECLIQVIPYIIHILYPTAESDQIILDIVFCTLLWTLYGSCKVSICSRLQDNWTDKRVSGIICANNLPDPPKGCVAFK